MGLSVTWLVTLNLVSLFYRVSEGQLLCTTPPSAALASVPIRLQVGGAKVPGSWTFHYRENPIVLGISPHCGSTYVLPLSTTPPVS